MWIKILNKNYEDVHGNKYDLGKVYKIDCDDEDRFQSFVDSENIASALRVYYTEHWLRKYLVKDLKYIWIEPKNPKLNTLKKDEFTYVSNGIKLIKEIWIKWIGWYR